jgi:hypothetical protein
VSNHSLDTANAIAGPTTTGVIQGGAPLIVWGFTINASTAATAILRSNGASGPIVGSVALAAAGVGSFVTNVGVKCVNPHLTITGTVTECGVLVD